MMFYNIHDEEIFSFKYIFLLSFTLLEGNRHPATIKTMKKQYSSLLISLTLVIMIVSCGSPVGTVPSTPDTVATIVAGTMGALYPLAASGTPIATIPGLTNIPFTPVPSSTSTTMATTVPSATATPGIGSISGSVYGYPYGAIPRFTIVAFNQETSYWLYWITLAGEAYYSTDVFIPEGKYQVVAYDASGHAGGCVSTVIVKANQTAVCDITDWSGSYPAKPGGAADP